MTRRARVLGIVGLACSLVLAACGSGGGGERQQRADELARLFDESWVPAGSAPFERLTTVDPCGGDCPPPAVSFSYVCACGDLVPVLTSLRDRLVSAGWRVNQGGPEEGFLRASRTGSAPAGTVELSVLTWPDAVQMQPRNAELQRIGTGRQGLAFGLSAP